MFFQPAEQSTASEVMSTPKQVHSDKANDNVIVTPEIINTSETSPGCSHWDDSTQQNTAPNTITQDELPIDESGVSEKPALQWILVKTFKGHTELDKFFQEETCWTKKRLIHLIEESRRLISVIWLKNKTYLNVGIQSTQWKISNQIIPKLSCTGITGNTTITIMSIAQPTYLQI